MTSLALPGHRILSAVATAAATSLAIRPLLLYCVVFRSSAQHSRHRVYHYRSANLRLPSQANALTKLCFAVLSLVSAALNTSSMCAARLPFLCLTDVQPQIISCCGALSTRRPSTNCCWRQMSAIIRTRRAPYTSTHTYTPILSPSLPHTRCLRTRYMDRRALFLASARFRPGAPCLSASLPGQRRRSASLCRAR